jgi:uncharacterized protein (DUF58 family)
MWTKKGWLYLSTGVVLTFVGLVFRSTALLVLSVMLLATVLVTQFFSRLGKIASMREMSSEKIFEDGIVTVDLALVNKGGRTGFLEIRDKLPKQIQIEEGTNYLIIDLRPNESLRMRYRVKAPIRGIYEFGPVTLRAQDVFNVFYKELELDLVDNVTVFPIVYDIKDLPIRSRTPKLFPGASKVKQPGPGTEFFLIRTYVPGDPFKNINWKAYARTGELLVNEKEREAVSDIVIMLDARANSATGTLGHNALIYGSRAAATLTNFFIKRRDSVALIVFGEKLLSIKPSQGSKQLYEILTALASVDSAGNLPMKGVVEVSSPYMPRRSPVILITNLDGDPTVIDAISILRTLEFDVVVLTPSSIEFELMSRKRLEAGVEKSLEYEVLRLERDILIQDLRGYGASIVEWDPKVPLLAILLSAAQSVGRTEFGHRGGDWS